MTLITCFSHLTLLLLCQTLSFFINEVLSTSEYSNYMSLKEAAKKNGFQFVWYSAGRVLVRRRETERVHVVSTVSYLAVILGSPRVESPFGNRARGNTPSVISFLGMPPGGPGGDSA